MLSGLSKLENLNLLRTPCYSILSEKEDLFFNELARSCPNLETLQIRTIVQGKFFQPLPKLK